jgi:acetate kinase
VILYLLQQEKMGADAIEHLIYEQSGLLGVSGLSSDMRTLLASELLAAKEAVDLAAPSAPSSQRSMGSCPRILEATTCPNLLQDVCWRVRRVL